jgi:hypothetical protein
MDRDKEDVRYYKKPINERLADIKNVDNAIASIRELKKTITADICKFERIEQTTTEGKEDNKKVAILSKENLFQDFSHKTMFEEVYKHSIMIIDKKKEEVRETKDKEKKEKDEEIED